MASTVSETITGGFSIRLARAEDLSSILQIERDSHSAAHWRPIEYQKAIAQSQRLVFVAERASLVLGFLVASAVTEEWELENIAVAPSERKRGVGRALMQALIAYAHQRKAVEIRQEIRLSNSTAQMLGQSVGFVADGQRRDYYHDPKEDALLFRYLVSEPDTD